MAETPTTELATHYYRDNFLRLCETVQTRYGDLLSLPEQTLLNAFYAQSFDAQCLYIRLISRVGPWFREARLNYPELGSVNNAVTDLLAAELLLEAHTLSADELGAVFTQPELHRLFAGHLNAKYVRKETLLQAIDTLALPEAELTSLVATFEPGRIVAPQGLNVIEVLQLLFFGNRHQGLTDFVLEDLGVVRYYPYTLDRAARKFPVRNALEEYLALCALSDAYYKSLEEGLMPALTTLAQEALSIAVNHPSSTSRYAKLCNRLARDLERLDELDLALKLYQKSQQHPARERTARILERQQNFSEAMRQCNTILQDPWSEEERDAAQRILPRMMRKLGEKPAPRPRDNFARTDLILCKKDKRVERLAAAALEPNWSSVHYVENSLMKTLFALAFWEQIFQPVPGVFHHAYQSAPTDIYEAAFSTRREAAITVRLQELERSDLRALLIQAYDTYHSYQCRWADWRTVDRALVSTATACLPKAHLLAIWRRMLFDPASNRRGFPDLIAFGDAPGHYAMIEVKGPGDALQDSQKRWLRFFTHEGIPASVAWVQWFDD